MSNSHTQTQRNLDTVERASADPNATNRGLTWV